MDNLRLVLIVLGGVAILGLLVHGLFVMRKNNTPKEQWGNNDEDMSPPSMDFSKPSRVEPQFDAQGFDEFGVGQARVVSTPKQANPEPDAISQEEALPEAPSVESSSAQNDLEDIPDIGQLNEVPKAEVEEPEVDEGPKYAPAVSNPKPVEHYQKKVTPAPVQDEAEVTITPPPAEFIQPDNDALENNTEVNNETVADPEVREPITATEPLAPAQQPDIEATKPTEQAQQKTKSKASLASMLFGSRAKAEKKQRKVDENQFSIDFDSVDPVLNEAKEQARAEQKVAAPPQYDPNIPPEVLCISVRAQDEQSITGARLLPLLLTLGLKFGDSDIFHRHVNNNGKGPVLFSLANMFKPGVFDIQHMETFETKGLTLFMTLPTESDAHQVFNMMHNAARKIADEFGAKVLDEARQELNMSGLHQYVERIRDFEKRRLLG